MKKIILSLSVFTLIASGCGNKKVVETENGQNTTMPPQSYVGLWQTNDNPPNELIIFETGDSITFEITVIDRVCTSGTAKIENNKIVFVTGNGFGGTMEFSENSILLKVEESNFGYLNVGETYNFSH